MEQSENACQAREQVDWLNLATKSTLLRGDWPISWNLAAFISPSLWTTRAPSLVRINVQSNSIDTTTTDWLVVGRKLKESTVVFYSLVLFVQKQSTQRVKMWMKSVLLSCKSIKLANILCSRILLWIFLLNLSRFYVIVKRPTFDDLTVKLT